MPLLTLDLAAKQSVVDRFYVMTVVLVMLHFTAPLPLQMLLWSLACLALIIGPRVRQYWGYWTAVVCVMAAGIVQLIRGEGNDVFLIFYIALTALFASHQKHPLRVLHLNGRWLLALVMSFAVLWKVFSPSFLSGSFFTRTLLFEERMAPFTLYLARLPREAYEANQRALINLAPPAGFMVHTNAAVLLLADILTWLTIAVEAAVAIAFLLPLGFARRVRDPLLILFCAGTYFILPVPSFGMAIATLGYIQTPFRSARVIYLLLYVFMPLTAIRVFLFDPTF